MRERRQEYVTELEEKVRRLEAGEGDKCVFYQQQAQRAKTESAALQQENDTLKKEIEVLRRELERAQSGRAAAPPAARGAAGGKDKGKGRAAPREFDDSASAGPTKRPRRSAAVRASVVVAQATGSSSPVFHYPPAESPVPALSPAGTSSSSSHSAYVHSPLNNFHDGPASPHHHPHLVPGAAESSAAAAAAAQHQRCTFCPADDNCFCAQVGYEIAPSPLPLPSQTTALLAAASSPAAQIKLEDADDLYFPETTYEPAVPLRLRKSGSKAPSVWAIEAPRAANAQSKRTVVAGAQAVCSGDPSNCPACSDDPYVRCAPSELVTMLTLVPPPLLQVRQGVLQRPLVHGMLVTAMHQLSLAHDVAQDPDPPTRDVDDDRRRNGPLRVADGPPVLRRPAHLRLADVPPERRGRGGGGVVFEGRERVGCAGGRDGAVQRGVDRAQAAPQHRLRRYVHLLILNPKTRL